VSYKNNICNLKYKILVQIFAGEPWGLWLLKKRRNTKGCQQNFVSTLSFQPYYSSMRRRKL
jgi:hypothetical protein